MHHPPELRPSGVLLVEVAAFEQPQTETALVVRQYDEAFLGQSMIDRSALDAIPFVVPAVIRIGMQPDNCWRRLRDRRIVVDVARHVLAETDW